MNITYKKIADVEVWHDYYMAKDINDEDYLLDNYSILKDLDFIPTRKCAQVLRNKKIIFKKSPKGFQLFAQAIPSVVSSTEYQTFIFIEPTVKLDFLLVVKNPFFFNFTNINLNDKGKLFHFSNVGKIAASSIVPLTIPHPVVTNAFTINRPFGEIIKNGTKLYELKSNVNNGTAFAAADHIEISDDQRTYVSTQDACLWQQQRYEYIDDNNTHPGEWVQFILTDELGNSMDLGNNTSTGLPQAKYRAPLP